MKIPGIFWLRNEGGSSLRENLSSWTVIAIFSVIYVISQAAISYCVREIGTLPVLRLQTTFSSETFGALLQQWRDTGLLGAYVNHFYFDFLHPVWYSILLSALLAKTFNLNEVPAQWNWVLVLPFLAGFFDLIENSIHVYYISTGNTLTRFPVLIGGLSANVKWVLTGVLLITVIILGGKTATSEQ